MSINADNMKLPVYLDCNASTPVDPRVLNAVVAVLRDDYGNPSSRHHIYGNNAINIVEHARMQVAGLINCSPREIIFTSGATESCNMAITGAATAYRERGNHIVTCMAEHKAVLAPCHKLANEGFDITFLRPDAGGRVCPEDVKNAINERTILVCVMAANNVVGTVNPITEIGGICKKRGVIFFCDATQALGKIDFDVERSGVDLAAFSSHKIYGTKGTGALYIRGRGPRVHISPLIFGGSQERGLRGGTENTAGIAGMGKACELLKDTMKTECNKVNELCKRLAAGLLSKIIGAQIICGCGEQLPNTLSISFNGVKAGDLLKKIPQIAASTDSACESGITDTNYVLKAIGINENIAAGAIRFSIGRFTTADQIDYVIKRVAEEINRNGDIDAH